MKSVLIFNQKTTLLAGIIFIIIVGIIPRYEATATAIHGRVYHLDLGYHLIFERPTQAHAYKLFEEAKPRFLERDRPSVCLVKVASDESWILLATITLVTLGTMLYRKED